MATVSGVRIIFDHFPQIAGNLRSQAGRAVADTARGIQGDAQAAAPVLTGALRSSISAAQAGTFAWRVTVTAPYAQYVEFGTGHGPAQPFLFPAAHNAEPTLISKLSSYLIGA